MESGSACIFFDLTPHEFPAEYEATCRFHQRSPQSHFTRQSVVSRLTDTGRVTLESDKLIVTEGGARQETAVREDEWSQLLNRHFGIVL